MKLNLNPKKNISGFKPDVHWKIILTTSFLLLLLAVAYSMYLYTFAQKQINAVTTTEVTATSSQLSNLASPEKIQEYFQVYRDRETKYVEIISTLTAGNKPVATTTLATTSSSTIVATTTNQ